MCISLIRYDQSLSNMIKIIISIITISGLMIHHWSSSIVKPNITYTCPLQPSRIINE